MYLQIHIIDFDDENNIINKNVLLHQVGEIWHISTSPADKGVLATCYNKSKSFLNVPNLYKCFDIFECIKFELLSMCRHIQLELPTQTFLKKSATLLPIPHLCHILRLSLVEVNFYIHVKTSSEINLMLGCWMQSMANKIYSCYFKHNFYWFICLLLKVQVNVFQNMQASSFTYNCRWSFCIMLFFVCEMQVCAHKEPQHLT